MTGSLPSLEHHPFSVSLSVFEGPLDLLLRLVESARLQITTVSLVQVTGQYLAYMRAERAIDHRALADFIAIGSRLIELKSRALLPSPPMEKVAEEEPEPEELVEMLLEYQRYKTVAALLRVREETGVRSFTRVAPPPDVPELPGLSNVTLERLVGIVQRALARAVPAPAPAPLKRARFTIRQKMAQLQSALSRCGQLSFLAVIDECCTREEIVASFLAVLELIKAERLVASQAGPFEDIVLVRAGSSGIAGTTPRNTLQAAPGSETELAGI